MPDGKLATPSSSLKDAPSRVWIGRPGPSAKWAILPVGDETHAAEAGWEIREYAPAGPGTPEGRMHAVWDWIHEDGAGRERMLEELCPGWSIVSSRITSERALMAAFDALVAERGMA